MVPSILRIKCESQIKLVVLILNTDSHQGNLGAIDDKYDVAISTASDALDYIVVDNMTTAMKGIEFLKKNNVGMATFIALDKMEKWRSQCNQTLKA